MTQHITPKFVAHLPQRNAHELEALDYLLLPDDNAGRIHTVTNDNGTITALLTNLATGKEFAAQFQADDPVSVIPG